MATIEQAVYSRLVNYTGLTALVGTRIYPGGRLPQNAIMPAVVISKVSTPKVLTMGGTSGNPAYPRYQIDIWGDGGSPSDVILVGEQIKGALEDYSGTVADVTIQMIFFDDERDMPYDSITNRYHRQQDYIIWHD